MKEYENKLGDLAGKLKVTKPATPIQEVHPVKPSTAKKDAEVQFNNWIPKALLLQLKTLALEKDLSLKELNIAALQDYINRHKSMDKH